MVRLKLSEKHAAIPQNKIFHDFFLLIEHYRGLGELSDFVITIYLKKFYILSGPGITQRLKRWPTDLAVLSWRSCLRQRSLQS